MGSTLTLQRLGTRVKGTGVWRGLSFSDPSLALVLVLSCLLTTVRRCRSRFRAVASPSPSSLPLSVTNTQVVSALLFSFSFSFSASHCQVAMNASMSRLREAWHQPPRCLPSTRRGTLGIRSPRPHETKVYFRPEPSQTCNRTIDSATRRPSSRAQESHRAIGQLEERVAQER